MLLPFLLQEDNPVVDFFFYVTASANVGVFFVLSGKARTGHAWFLRAVREFVLFPFELGSTRGI